MTLFNRRLFLQSAAGALGAIGLSQLAMSQRANHYGKALAQSTSRKIALLVGVNSYTRNSLGGAITDIELQKQLLIHRFGFNSNDVHTLPNEKATRLNILDAFEEYLYEPARTNDVIVFHFSGHGDRVLESALMRDFTNRLEGRSCIDDGDGSSQICKNTAIAPFRYDEAGADTVQDIMGHTLLLMRTALARKTDNVTFVLDCCFAGGGKRGNAMMRSLEDPTITSITPRIADIEWEYQQSWLERLNMSEDDFVRAIKSPTGPGFFAGAAGKRQYAADYPFEGFVAGAFTYLLTQHLWQNTSPLSTMIPAISSSLSRLQNHDQTPEYEPDLSTSRSLANKTIYHITPSAPPAEAIITGYKADDRLELWLGGLDPQRLVAFDQGTTFSILDSQTRASVGEVRQIAGTRDGLFAQGELVSETLKQSRFKQGNSVDKAAELTSRLLQEKTRGIPDVVVLKIALDDTLTSAEQDYAITALGQSASFEVFPTAVGQSAHVLLGRYTEAIAHRLVAGSTSTLPTPAVSSIGVFSPTQVPILAGSFGPENESIEAAIERLRSRFISLHIGRMLALMVNRQSSKIDIDVTIKSADFRSGTTTRGGNPDAIFIPQQSEQGIEQISLQNEIDVVVKNNEASALHFGMLAIDSAGDISVLFPITSDDPNIDVIRSGASKTEPLVAVEPLGLVELLVLASPQSLVGPLDTLRDKASELSDPNRSGSAVSAQDAVSGIFGAMSTQPGDGTAEKQQQYKGADSKEVEAKRTGKEGAEKESIKVGQLLDVEDVAVVSMLFEIVP